MATVTAPNVIVPVVAFACHLAVRRQRFTEGKSGDPEDLAYDPDEGEVYERGNQRESGRSATHRITNSSKRPFRKTTDCHRQGEAPPLVLYLLPILRRLTSSYHVTLGSAERKTGAGFRRPPRRISSKSRLGQ